MNVEEELMRIMRVVEPLWSVDNYIKGNRWSD